MMADLTCHYGAYDPRVSGVALSRRHSRLRLGTDGIAVWADEGGQRTNARVQAPFFTRERKKGQSLRERAHPRPDFPGC